MAKKTTGPGDPFDPDDPTIIRLGREFKAQLLRREQAFMSEMATRWGAIMDDLETELEGVIREIRTRQNASGTITPGSIQRLKRYEQLYAQAQMNAAVYAAYAENLIKRQVIDYSNIGVGQGVESILAAMKEAGRSGEIALAANMIDVGALQELAGVLRDGSPIRKAIMEAFPQSWETFEQNLINGMVEGVNPRKIVEECRDLLGAEFEKALMIARTETLRAYRNATSETYKQSGIVKAWQRLASLSSRTCMACIALDGKVYPMSKPLVDHPNGRCTMIPILTGETHTPSFTTATDWFLAQDEQTQRDMLGNAKYEAWKNGLFAIGDLAKFHQSSDYGLTPGETPLKDLLPTT